MLTQALLCYGSSERPIKHSFLIVSPHLQTSLPVTMPVSEELNVGVYTTQWNAADAASGVYFYQMRAGDFVHTKKLLWLK